MLCCDADHHATVRLMLMRCLHFSDIGVDTVLLYHVSAAMMLMFQLALCLYSCCNDVDAQAVVILLSMLW